MIILNAVILKLDYVTQLDDFGGICHICVLILIHTSFMCLAWLITDNSRVMAAFSVRG